MLEFEPGGGDPLSGDVPPVSTYEGNPLAIRLNICAECFLPMGAFTELDQANADVYAK